MVMSRSTFPKFAFALALAASSLALPLLSGTVAAEVQSEGLTVWIPPLMLSGEKYRGVVIVTDVADYSREVMLVSSSPDVVVPDRVTVEPGMHHGVFDIEVRSPAAAPESSTATVSVVMEGMFGEASTVLHDKEAAGSKVVRLLAFNSTSLSFARVVAMTERAAGSDYSLDAANTSATLA